MRIIGEIPHPYLKITIFKTGDRVSVKFENAGYEQAFKLGSDERFQEVKAVESMLDSAFMAGVLKGFEQMHQLKMAAVHRAFPAEDTHEFETIL